MNLIIDKNIGDYTTGLFVFHIFIQMEHATGIEPARLAWEAKVLPLNYACMVFIVS